MFIPKGKKTVTIKKYNDLHITCENCGHKKHQFSVIQEFFFIFFIPIYASSQKTIQCECLNCSNRQNSKKKDYYISKTRTPFYFYSGFLIVASIVIIGLIGNIYTQFKKAEYVEDPHTGDIYLIIDERGEKDMYYYLKVNELRDDSLILLHNNVKYHHFVVEMNDSDYFSSDGKITIHKNILNCLLKKGQLNTINRDYKSNSGFCIER